MGERETMLALFIAALCVVALISHFFDNGDSFGDDLYN